MFLPVGWDYTFICPNCLSYGQWIDSGRPEEDVAAAPKPKKEAPAFHDETIPLPKRMEMAKDGNLALKLYAAMAQTDCTACGYDCEGYAAALANGKEKDPNLCVPGQGRDGQDRQGPPARARAPRRLRLIPRAHASPASLSSRRSRPPRSPRHARIGRLNVKRLPLADGALRPDRAAVQLDQRPREREPDPHPGMPPRRRSVHLAEALEDVRQLALRDADAVVLDAHEVSLRLALDADDDAPETAG